MRGDNLNHRITLRLSDQQYNFLMVVSDVLGVSPSDYLRMSINSGLASAESDEFMKGLLGGMSNYENVETNINDKL